MTTAENLQGKRKEICKEVLNLNEKLNTYMLNKPKKDDQDRILKTTLDRLLHTQ